MLAIKYIYIYQNPRLCKATTKSPIGLNKCRWESLLGRPSGGATRPSRVTVPRSWALRSHGHSCRNRFIAQIIHNKIITCFPKYLFISSKKESTSHLSYDKALQNCVPGPRECNLHNFLSGNSALRPTEPQVCPVANLADRLQLMLTLCGG